MGVEPKRIIHTVCCGAVGEYQKKNGSVCMCMSSSARYERSGVTESECSLPAKLPRDLREACSVCAATLTQWVMEKYRLQTASAK